LGNTINFRVKRFTVRLPGLVGFLPTSPATMDRFRALSLFQPANLNAAIGAANNEPHGEIERPQHMFGAMLGIPHTQMARLVAVLGFDFIFIDTLHVYVSPTNSSLSSILGTASLTHQPGRPTNPETLVALIQTIAFASEGKTVAVVRVPSPDSDLLPHALDAGKRRWTMNQPTNVHTDSGQGAAGIIFPQVDTPAQAEAAVYKVRHAYSGGNRSISPLALYDGLTNLAPPGWTSETIADRNIAVICQIESAVSPLRPVSFSRVAIVPLWVQINTDLPPKLAVENAEAIANVPGVDVLMVGVADLKATLGIPTRNPDGLFDETKFYDAIATLKAISKNTGIQLMIPTFRLRAEDIEWLQDFKMIVTSVDVLNVMRHHRLDLARMKEALGVEDGQSNEVSNGYTNGHTNGHSHKADKEELGRSDGLPSYHLNGNGVGHEEEKDGYKADSGTE
jgi:2-keto-3-deoxy-L-rhamnonate aldolase RhmA